MLKLPINQIDQLPKNELLFIFNKILDNNYTVRLIGGCVRDLLLDRPVTDFDIATSMFPQKIVEVFTECSGDLNVKCISTALKYGTIILIVNNKKFEVTTLRKDIECLGRAANVEFIDDWKEDANRRDFTINAMSMDLEGNIYDYFNGYNDALNKIVRYIGDPKSRIEEDYLRALRYFRFCSYLGLDNIDKASMSASLNYMHKLSLISGERIKLESEKIFTSKYSKSVIKLLIKRDCLQYIGLPRLSIEDVEKLNFSNDFIINLSALLLTLCQLSKQKVGNIVAKLKLSKKEKMLLNNLCFPKIEISFDDDLAMQNKYIYMIGKELYADFLTLHKVFKKDLNYKLLYNNLNNYESKKLPINGFDIEKLGFKKENIGKVLSVGEKYWIDNNFEPAKNKIIAHIKELNKRDSSFI